MEKQRKSGEVEKERETVREEEKAGESRLLGKGGKKGEVSRELRLSTATPHSPLHTPPTASPFILQVTGAHTPFPGRTHGNTLPWPTLYLLWCSPVAAPRGNES